MSVNVHKKTCFWYIIYVYISYLSFIKLRSASLHTTIIPTVINCNIC